MGVCGHVFPAVGGANMLGPISINGTTWIIKLLLFSWDGNGSKQRDRGWKLGINRRYQGWDGDGDSEMVHGSSFCTYIC